MSEDAVYLCMPSYSQPHAGAARQFWARATNPEGPYRDLQRIFDDKGASLLANAFNEHWCNALNLQTQGVPVTRFAMLHNDVQPADWWLDQLLSDMEETGADLVAAAIPIKDPRGLSSTAIDDPNDEWEVLRRLTMHEIHALPEVFSAADCGYPDNLLLANTGCWLADFTRPWRFEVHFEIRDRISRREDGTFYAQAFPEDWNFSRQVGRLGGRVLVTRRVRVHHHGGMGFPNDGPWGEMTADEHLRRKFGDRTIPPVANGQTHSQPFSLATQQPILLPQES